MRLIDADELKIDYGFTWNDVTPTHDEMYALIDRQPTIEPERKGKWLPDNNNYITPHFVCSACGMSQKVETVMYKPIWAFCPRCGARMMRGEQDG